MDNIKLAIEGYNAEKLSIREQLKMAMGGSNAEKSVVMDCDFRLSTIDKKIYELLKLQESSK